MPESAEDKKTVNTIPPDLGKKERVLELARKDIVTFGQLFMPEDFLKSQPAPFQFKLSEILLNSESKRKCIILPRGHAQSLDSKVLTPVGWSTIGELKVGDSVIGADGKPTKVVQLHPTSEMRLFEVSTRDGRSTVCNGEHLWQLTCPSNTGQKPILKSVNEILKNYGIPRYDKRDGSESIEYRYFLHTCKPIEFEHKDFLIDPYTLGAWLGDGDTDGGRITSADPEILEYIPYKITDNKTKYRYGIIGLRVQLRKEGLLGNKHIPKEYLLSSIEQRQALLQGLIDTDGYVSNDGMQIGLCNTNKRIIDGIVEIIRSLGGTVSLGEQLTRFDKYSEYRHSYRLTARLPKEITPVRLTRKLSKWKGSIKTKSAIVDISYYGKGLARCITVQNPDGLYITDDYMVTHNSKSTMSKAALLHNLYFNPSDTREFIAWVSEEQSQAVDHIKYIQNHIDTNPALQYYFGDLKGSKWTEKEFTTSKGDRIIAKGTTQRLRGRSQLGLRYTKIVLDDFESELNTKTPERRREIKEWVMSTVEPALENEAGKEGEIWLVGTIVHFDSFLQAIYDGYLTAKKDNTPYSWDVMFRKAMNPDGTVLWSNYFSWDKLQATKRRFEELGLPHKFAQEFQNEARDADNMKFQTQKINWYDGQIVQRGGFAYLLTRNDAIPVNVYLGVDLAYEHQARHDFQVIFALAIDSDKNYYVLEYYREHSPLYDMPEQILKFARDYQPLKRVNVEHVGAQGVIKDAVNALAMKDRRLIPGIARGVRPPIGIKKEDKLEALLCPIVNRGKLYMKRNQQHLIDEMFQFPKSKNDDLLDGFWLSAIHARPPKSHKFPREGFEETIDNMREKKSIRQKISWITGQKI